MNFVHQGFQNLSSDRQTDTTEIIYHASSRVVSNSDTRSVFAVDWAVNYFEH